MRKYILLLFASFLFTFANSQISQPGEPLMFSKSEKLGVEIPTVEMPAFDLKKLKEEDFYNDQQKSVPYRFGFNHEVNYSLLNSGVWKELPNGDRVWYLRVFSKDAMSLNFQYSKFFMPKGARMFVFSEDKSNYIGAFTSENNKPSGKFGSTLVKGESVIIEYFEPKDIAGQGMLELSVVTHGYRDLFGYFQQKSFGDAGSCNVNVICPEGDDWRDQIRSVAVIISGGSEACTGALINNTCEDGKPYFLTANHCLGGDESTWIFRFNWESDQCSPSNNGPTNQTVSGSILRANNANSDFGLLEILETPPSEYNVYYAGWDKTLNVPEKGIAIHHPSGDIKKISFENEPLVSTNYSGAEVWQITDWDLGTTEPGSSGSPLFNQNGHIVGQLYGGSAACGNNSDDNYGRLNESWEAGSTEDARLKEWLDGCGQNVDFINGYDPNGPALALDAHPVSIKGVPSFSCSSAISPYITFRNKGENDITNLTVQWSILGTSNSGILPWTGLIAQNQIDTVFIGDLNLPSGDYTFRAITNNPNSSTDLNMNNDTIEYNFTLLTNGLNPTLTVKTDYYGSEVSWKIIDESGDVVNQGGPYSDGFASSNHIENLCMPAGCYTFKVYDSYGDGMGASANFSIEFEGGDLFYHTGDEYTDSMEVDFCLTSAQAPVASFSYNPSTICTGNSIQFIDNSTNSPDQLTWNFEGGTPSSSNEPNPTINYANAGVYSVTLTVSSTNGMDVLVIPNITVSEGISLTETLTNPSAFSLSNGSISVAVSGSSSAYTYQWNNGETTSSISGLPNGDYTLQATSAEGCVANETYTLFTPNSLNENLGKGNSFVLYPNPTDGKFYFLGNTNSLAEYEIFNSIGQLLQKGSTNNKEAIELNQSGIYFVRIKNSNHTEVQRLVVK